MELATAPLCKFMGRVFNHRIDVKKTLTARIKTFKKRVFYEKVKHVE